MPAPEREERIRVDLTRADAETLRNFAKHYGPRSSFPVWWEQRILAILVTALNQKDERRE